MFYLHDKLKIVHRDLKGTNIFIDKNENDFIVKIGDFGHCLNSIKNLKRDRCNIGTIEWMV